MEIDITEVIILGVMVASAFSLGFIFGKAYVKRKMKRREEEALADYLPEHPKCMCAGPISARYAPDKGEPQMEVCEIEEKEPKEDDETRDGRDGWGIGEGHEEPSK